jgi:hypothetical protein
VYHYQWAIVNDTLLLKFITIEDGKEQLMQPVGEFPKSLQDKIIQYAQTLDYKLTIYGVSNAFVSQHPEFVANFERLYHLVAGARFEPILIPLINSNIAIFSSFSE